MGALSQALTNLETAIGQAGTITGLPLSAANLRADLVTKMNDILNAVKPIQGAVAWFVSSVTPPLTNAEAAVAANPQAVSGLSNVSMEAANVNATVDGAANQITTIASYMTSTLGSLAALEGTLGSQVAGLQNGLPAAQSAAAAAYSRMAMYGSLGVLDFSAFLAARTQYLKDQAAVNQAETMISTLQPQIRAVTLMASLFKNDIPTLLAKVTAVKNAAAHLATVLPQLVAQGTGTPAAVGAVLADVQAMGIDVS